MADDQKRRPGLQHHAKVQGVLFLPWRSPGILIAAGLYHRPDLIKQALRASTRAIESVGDALPSPRGDRIEIMLQEIGGYVWLQITALIVALRVVFWAIAASWRRGKY